MEKNNCQKINLNEDPLAPAKGMIIGFILSSAFWALLFYLFYQGIPK